MDAAAFRSRFETFELDAKTLEIEHVRTITPQAEPAAGQPSLPSFRTLEGAEDADFRILETIGEGGMGVVSLAEQVALKRLVAVKEPRDDTRRGRGRILGEALILGQMEHPNVVPAHALGANEHGAPLLVMKRVEGTSWQSILDGAAAAPHGVEPDLGWHLRVLLQVCNALRFAHARQVVHRDVKPDNVMIGEFGEVYLMDWGIAMSLTADGLDGRHPGSASRGLAGTPAYMAPEMTDTDPAGIDERTDVYLVGASLHQLLVGEPPHAGDSLFDVCLSAYRSATPEYPADAPSELAAIAIRAMSRDKEDRFQSIADLAAALQGYLDHRASYVISAAARAKLDEAGDRDEAEAATMLLEAEFGFRQALDVFAQNVAAVQGLQEAVERRVRDCVSRSDLVGARAAFERLPEPNAEMANLVDELAADLLDRAERVDFLERFQRELSLETGMRTRQKMVLLLGLAFAAVCAAQAYQFRPGEPQPTAESMMRQYPLLAGIAALGLLAFRKKLLGNSANRRLTALFASSLIFLLVARASGVLLQLDAIAIQLSEVLIVGVVAFALGVASSKGLAVTALLYGVVALFGAWVGQFWAFVAGLAVAHIVFCSHMAWLWHPRPGRQPASD